MPPGRGEVAVAYNNDAAPVADGEKNYRFTVTVLGTHGGIDDAGVSAEIVRGDSVRHAVFIQAEEFENLPDGKKLNIVAQDSSTVDFMLGQ